MIKLQELTPEVYYKQSRDFQYIGRLFDVVLNSVKTNADMIYSIPSSDAAGSKLIELLALTLGFSAKHEYSVKQLAAICSIFPLILKNKGNKTAIDLIGQALLNSEGITQEFISNIDADNPYTILLLVPSELSDINLLKDLLPYVLPAGFNAEIVRNAINEQNSTTEVKNSSALHTYVFDSEEKSVLFSNETISKGTDKDQAGFITNSTIFNGGDVTIDSTPEEPEESGYNEFYKGKTYYEN